MKNFCAASAGEFWQFLFTPGMGDKNKY